MNEKKRIARGPSSGRYHMVTAVWGEFYIDLLLNYTLPCLLSPNNLPVFCREHRSVYRLFTRESDAEVIKASGIISELSELAEIRYNYIDDIDLSGFAIKNDNINLMIRSHQIAVEEAQKENAGVILMVPDAFFSDGSFAALSEIINAGALGVMLHGFRVARESFFPEVKKRVEEQGRAGLTLENRDLVDMIMRHAHKFNRSTFWDSDIFNRHWPNQLNWWVGDEGFLCRNYHYHPIMFDPPKKGILPPRTADFHYLSHVYNSIDEMHVVVDSDEMLCCSITPENHFDNTPWGKYPPAEANFRDVVHWMKTGADWLHREFFKIRCRFHRRDYSELWEKVELESDRVVHTCVALLEPWGNSFPLIAGGPRAAGEEPGGADIPAGAEKHDKRLFSLLQAANEIMMAGAAQQIDISAKQKLQQSFEQLGLYDEALNLLNEIKESMDEKRFESKSRMILKKDQIKKEEIRTNYEKNMTALKQVEPDAGAGLENPDITGYQVAGDHRTGYRLVTCAAGGRLLQATYSAGVIAGTGEKLNEILQTVKKQQGAIIAGLPYFGLLTALAGALKEKMEQGACRLFFIEPDAQALAAALQLTDLSGPISRKELVLFTGGKCFDALAAWFDSHPFVPIPDAFYIADPANNEPLGNAVRAIKFKQADVACHLKNRLNEECEKKRRLKEGRAGEQENAQKALLFSSRFSRVSATLASGLSKAFESMGHEAVIAEESDMLSYHNAMSMLLVLNDVLPDMVVFCGLTSFESESIVTESISAFSFLLGEEGYRRLEELAAPRIDNLFAADPGRVEASGLRYGGLIPLDEGFASAIMGAGGAPADEHDFEKLAKKMIEAARGS